MQEPHIEDLRTTLGPLLASQDTPDGVTPEAINTSHLIGLVQEFDVGNIPLEDVQSEFARLAPDFGFDLWIAEKVKEGVYPKSILSSE